MLSCQPVRLLQVVFWQRMGYMSALQYSDGKI